MIDYDSNNINYYIKLLMFTAFNNSLKLRINFKEGRGTNFLCFYRSLDNNPNLRKLTNIFTPPVVWEGVKGVPTSVIR